MTHDYFNSKTNFERKYTVYLERTALVVDGYKYCRPELAPSSSDKKHFKLVFHFKKSDKSINPMIIIDSMEGDDFSEKIDILSHFKKNHALTYAVECDGLDKFIKEGKNDKPK